MSHQKERTVYDDHGHHDRAEPQHSSSGVETPQSNDLSQNGDKCNHAHLEEDHSAKLPARVEEASEGIRLDAAEAHEDVSHENVQRAEQYEEGCFVLQR